MFFVGLTPNENTISPIENLDGTVGRLYSYLSGSEGDIETDNPNTPLKKKQMWAERAGGPPCPHSAVSTPSSRSRSSSMSISDQEEECIENPYSHISDTGEKIHTLASIGHASLVFVLRDVTRFMVLSPRLVQ